MKRLRLMTLALLLLLLCACATAQPATTTKPQAGPQLAKPAQQTTENPLRDQTVVKIDFQGLVLRSKSFQQTLVTLGAIALILALLEILFGGRSVLRWGALMVLVLLWPLLADAFASWAGGSWTLTREFLDETLGLKKGLLPTGDLLMLIPWAKSAVNWTVDLITLALKVTHGLVSWAFFLAVIPLVLQNYLAMTMGNRRFQTSLLVLLLTLATFRHYVPEVLAEATTRLHATRVEVTSSLPLVKELVEPLLNTIKGTAQQTTLQFIGTWWGYTFGLLAIAVIFAITLSTLAAPYVGAVSNRVGRTVKRYGGAIRREAGKAAQATSDRGPDEGSRPVSQREFRQRLRQTEETLRREVSSGQPATKVSDAEPPPSGWRQSSSGLLVPDRGSSSSVQPGAQNAQGKDPARNGPVAGQRAKQAKAQEAGRKLSGIATGGIAPKVMADPGGNAQAAGAVATAAGHPEIGTPLTAAGSAVKKGRGQRSRQGPAAEELAQGPGTLSEDPNVTKERDALDRALEAFFGGGEGGEA